MKQLTIILGILLAALGCADNKKDGPATLDNGSSKRMTELDSLSKISIIKDTTVWPGFNRVNRNGQRMGMWKETGTFYYEYEYSEDGNEVVFKKYSRLTGTLMCLVHNKENNRCDTYYHFDYKRPLDFTCLNFRPNKEYRKLARRIPNSNVYKYRCTLLSFFRNGTISSIEEIDYDEDPLWDGEELWVRYFKEDGTESDVDLYDYKWKGRDLNNLDSCGRRQGLWLEDDGYREVYYKDGVVDGIFRSYSRKTGTLLSIGWYCKGMLSGRWFYFDEQGKLLRIDDHPDLEGSPVWLANSYLSK